MCLNPFVLLKPHRDQKPTQFPQPRTSLCLQNWYRVSLADTKPAFLLELPASVQEAQGALLDFLSSLLAGYYLEDSWKTLEYLQGCSKLQWVGTNLVWESNGIAKLKYSFFFAQSWPITYQVFYFLFYFLLTQSLFLLQFPRSSKPSEYENLTLELIKELFITVNSQLIFIQRTNINKEKRLGALLNHHIWALSSNKPGRLREYFL